MNERLFESPDGVFRVEFQAFEMRMSHWVETPRVIHAPTGRVLIDLWGTLWDASVKQEQPGQLALILREYPGSGAGYSLVLDATTETATRTRGDKTDSLPFAELGQLPR